MVREQPEKVGDSSWAVLVKVDSGQRSVPVQTVPHCEQLQAYHRVQEQAHSFSCRAARTRQFVYPARLPSELGKDTQLARDEQRFGIGIAISQPHDVIIGHGVAAGAAADGTSISIHIPAMK